MDWKPVLLFLHIASDVVWVGGMFFAYMCLRPVAASQLPPPQRLPLWAAVFARFFPWVWLSVALLLATGMTMLLEVGVAHAPLNWHLMFGVGIVMMLIFGFVFFVPYRRLQRAVAVQQWSDGGAALNQIRRLVGINLSLGAINIAVATLGHWLSH